MSSCCLNQDFYSVVENAQKAKSSSTQTDTFSLGTVSNGTTTDYDDDDDDSGFERDPANFRCQLSRKTVKLLLLSTLAILLTGLMTHLMPDRWIAISDYLATTSPNVTKCVQTEIYAKSNSSLAKWCVEWSCLAIGIISLAIIASIPFRGGFTSMFEIAIGWMTLGLSVLTLCVVFALFMIQDKMRQHLGIDFCAISGVYTCSLLSEEHFSQRCWAGVAATFLSVSAVFMYFASGVSRISGWSD